MIAITTTPHTPLRHALASACVAASLALGTTASGQHVDILPYDDNGAEPGGKITTGFFDFDAQAYVEDVRLYVRALDFVLSDRFGSTSPGFVSDAQFPLLPDQPLSFDIGAIPRPGTGARHNLLYWDGEGPPDFGAPPQGADLFFRQSSSINATADGGPDDVPGFLIDFTGPEGNLHKHISFAARGDGGQPPDGFYLTSIVLHMPGLESSEPIFLLFNADYVRDESDQIVLIGDRPQVNGDSEAAATDWVLRQLVTVPGDFDLDGDVDAFDLGIWQTGFGVMNGARFTDGDADGDADVDAFDLGLWQTNFGTGATAVGGTPIPEPGAGAVALIVGVGLASRARGRNR